MLNAHIDAPSVASVEVYDMRFELNEVEARMERYPSTISYLNLLNSLISQETDVSDRGLRFVGIFRFIYDQVFGPFPLRAYADPKEKWQLVIACLEHFHLVLKMYDLRDEDIINAVDISQPSSVPPASNLEIQFPILELLKDFMSGKVVFRNIMSIILLGVNMLINERTSHTYGLLLEKAVHLSLEVIILVFERDLFLAEFWRPLYQPLDVILSQDHTQIISLLDSRIVGLVQLLLKANAAKCLIEDYAACLESRFDESAPVENTKDDAGVLIMQHLDSFGIAQLPPRTSKLALRISTLHQRAWLLKLLAFELHSADMADPLHKESCLAIIRKIFAQHSEVNYGEPNSSKTFVTHPFDAVNGTSKIKALELLEIVHFKPPDIGLRYPQFILNTKYHKKVEDILSNSAISEMGGVYFYSERGDRLIDLDAFHDALWQMLKFSTQPGDSPYNIPDKGEISEVIQKLLRWAWKYNKNLEEQAAQLHMLTGWSHVVEVSVSRKALFIEDHSQFLFELLDASLSVSASPDCSLKMALVLSHLLPNGACHSILLKLIVAILRTESSEALRIRQYALLLSYFQYCRNVLDPEIPRSVIGFLVSEDQGDDELNLQKIDKEQAELARTNFAILKKEAEAMIDVVSKDAIEGSEVLKAMAFYALDTFIDIDEEKLLLSQLQSKGIPRSALLEISNFSVKDGGRCSVDSLQHLCTLEAELAMLLRISHRYNKHGAQLLLSIGALEHLRACRAPELKSKGFSRHCGNMVGMDIAGEFAKRNVLVTSILRLVSCLTSLVDSLEFLEVKNKIVRDVVDFIKHHQLFFDQILSEDISLADEVTLEQIDLVVSILSRVWPYEENDGHGFLQGIFRMINFVFKLDVGSNGIGHFSDPVEKKRMWEVVMFKLCFSLASYLYFLITKKLMRLQVSDITGSPGDSIAQQVPTLDTVVYLLSSVTAALVRAGEEKVFFLNKIQNINELSRQEVDEIIDVCIRRDYLSPFDSIQKRRYVAMVEMCRIIGIRDQLVIVLLQLAECLFNILLIHLQDSNFDSGDISLLCEKLHPTLEKLEHLREDRLGHDLKLFHRTINMLKELSIRNLALKGIS
ncbi:hypothetical protein HPP92_008667 [Vanilla planifolia]|uniref:Nuclear pore complex protein NUP205 n=1 Tax=Vanilla planifolia TaxID=51239 RepID=A0A835R6H8_VANPL|nr:hypothetical protein HPP92_008667 [Vanilla planifolia]